MELITKHIHVSDQTRVLDLACGKGAVSVILAKKLGCMIKGIDIIPEFIDFAINKAQEFGVRELCEFLVGDITELVKTEKDYDIVILGGCDRIFRVDPGYQLCCIYTALWKMFVEFLRHNGTSDCDNVSSDFFRPMCSCTFKPAADNRFTCRLNNPRSNE